MVEARMVVVLLVLLGAVVAQKCGEPSDCTSPHAPHCSRWGWCQWTAEYGAAGPRTDLPDSGYCNANTDCVPHAPFCSRQGYCTQRPGQHRTGQDRRGEDRHPRGDGKDRAEARSDVRPRGRSSHRGKGGGRPRSRGGPGKHKPQVPRTQDRGHKAEDRRHRGQGRLEDRLENRVEEQAHLAEEPRGRAVVPSGTFLLTQVSGFGQRRKDPVEGRGARPRNLPAPPAPRNLPAPPAPRSPPTPPTPPPRRRTTGAPVPVPVFPDIPDTIDRQASEHFQVYDYSDYDYYADFEVQKTQPAAAAARPEGRGLEEERVILKHPEEGASQGCLYDCVYDCVSITELAAYRDCVDFCGKTCRDKK